MAGEAYAGQSAYCTRVLLLLGVEGPIVRARPGGSWINGQYRWATERRWRPAAGPSRTERRELVVLGYGPSARHDRRPVVDRLDAPCRRGGPCSRRRVRSISTAPRGGSCPTTSTVAEPTSPGSRCSRTRPRRSWDGKGAIGTSARARRACSIATATAGRTSGWTDTCRRLDPNPRNKGQRYRNHEAPRGIDERAQEAPLRRMPAPRGIDLSAGRARRSSVETRPAQTKNESCEAQASIPAERRNRPGPECLRPAAVERLA